MVSPKARDTAKMNEATSPEIAAGITTRTVVVILRAPKPEDASRNDIGTAFMASSEMDATSGMMRTPTPMPEASSEPAAGPLKRVLTTLGAIHSRAKKPRTTLGIPARISKMGLSVRRTRGRAYSDRKMAAPKPSGAATIMAIPVTIKLATISVLMS